MVQAFVSVVAVAALLLAAFTVAAFIDANNAAELAPVCPFCGAVGANACEDWIGG